MSGAGDLLIGLFLTSPSAALTPNLLRETDLQGSDELALIMIRGRRDKGDRDFPLPSLDRDLRPLLRSLIGERPRLPDVLPGELAGVLRLAGERPLLFSVLETV